MSIVLSKETFLQIYRSIEEEEENSNNNSLLLSNVKTLINLLKLNLFSRNRIWEIDGSTEHINVLEITELSE